MRKKLTGGLSAEHRRMIEQLVGYTDLAAEPPMIQTVRQAIHVLDHGGNLDPACRDKIEGLGALFGALFRALDEKPGHDVLSTTSAPITTAAAPTVVTSTQMGATEIIPRLFLGGRRDAEALGPRVPDDWACVSVTEYRSRYKRKEELPYEPKGSLDMPFMVDGPEGWYADPYKLDLIAETIWWRLQIGKKVLVHCIHAQERTPIVIAWYLAWSGESPSITRAYETVARLHPRTKRRDKWLRGAVPQKCCPSLEALLAAARARATAIPQLRAAAATKLEDAATAWVARTTRLKT